MEVWMIPCVVSVGAIMKKTAAQNGAVLELPGSERSRRYMPKEDSSSVKMVRLCHRGKGLLTRV